MPDFNKIRKFVAEAAPSSFSVDYYVMTPKGSKARFQRNAGLLNLNMCQSEFAVLNWLRKLHPGCEIVIRNLSFK